MVHTGTGSEPEGSVCLVHGNISNERWKGAHLSYISVTTKAACFFNQIPSQEILPRASPTPELLYFFLPAADYFENNLPGVLMTPEPCHRPRVSRLGSFSGSPPASLSRWPQLYPTQERLCLFTRPPTPPSGQSQFFMLLWTWIQISMALPQPGSGGLQGRSGPGPCRVCCPEPPLWLRRWSRNDNLQPTLREGAF